MKLDTKKANLELKLKIKKITPEVSVNDDILMKFLEQSARYLGCYIKKGSVDLTNNRTIS